MHAIISQADFAWALPVSWIGHARSGRRSDIESCSYGLEIIYGLAIVGLLHLVCIVVVYWLAVLQWDDMFYFYTTVT